MDFDRQLASNNVQTIDLAIGDCVRIGQQALTIVDIDGDEVCFRVDAADQLITIARAGVKGTETRPSTPR